MSDRYSLEDAWQKLWMWLTENGDSEPQTTPPEVRVSGVASVNLDAADDEVAVYGAQDGTGALHVVNVDSAGRVRTDSTVQLADADVSTSNPLPTRISDGTDQVLVTAAGELNVIATAQPGVDIGDVTVNNASGASAVNVQDGGNSLTVDNAVLSVVGGGTEATAQRVTLASDSTGVLSVDDNGSSLTVDQATASLLNATVVGAAADGAATSGNPVLIAGQDENVTPIARALRTSTGGILHVMGHDADGAASSTNPVEVGGKDGSGNVQSLLTETDGKLDVVAVGNVAHDAADSGNPVKVGAKAIAHGTNPTAVAANDRTDLYANRAGVPFVIGGHPNVQTAEYNFTTAPTNDDIVAVSAGTKIVVTAITASTDEACTVGVSVRIGFGDSLATAPADQASAVGTVFSHPGLVPGAQYGRGDGSGILGVGADGEDLSITAEVPTGGSGKCVVSYYTIES